MAYDDETQMRIAEWRRKMAEGTLTEEEAIEAVRTLRGGNRTMAIAGASKARTKAAPVNVDNLLDELGGLK